MVQMMPLVRGAGPSGGGTRSAGGADGCGGRVTALQRVLRMASVAALAMAAGALEGWGRWSRVVPGRWRDYAVRVS